MKKIILAIFAIALIGGGAYTLFNNKKKIDAAKVQKQENIAVPVAVSILNRQTVNSEFSYIGTFAANKEVNVVAEAQGKILKVFVKEGDYVKQGQTLAKIDDTMLQIQLQTLQSQLATQQAGVRTAESGLSTAQSGLATAKKTVGTTQNAYQTALTLLDKANKDLARFENLAKENATTDVMVQNAKAGVTQAQAAVNQAEAGINQVQGGVNQAEMAVEQAKMSIEQARLGVKSVEAQIKTVQEQLAKTSLVAPISGVLTLKNFEVGSMASPASPSPIPMGTVTDVSALKLIVMIPEGDILKFSEGQGLQLKTDVYDGVTYSGTVSLISVKSDNAHNYKMEVAVQNSAANPIKAGMYGRLVGQSVKGLEGLFIPRNALVGSIKEPKVFVAQSGKALLRPITIGMSSGELIEVKEGLSVGEQLIITGQINLEDQTSIEILDNAAKASVKADSTKK